MKGFNRLSFLIICLPILSYGQMTFTLEEAIAYGLEHSMSITLSEYEIRDAAAQVNEYKSIGLPQVKASIDYQHFLEIPTQIIPDFISPFVDGRLVNYSLIDPSQVPTSTGPGLPAQFGTKNTFSLGADASMLLFDGSYFVGLRAAKLSQELSKRNQEVTVYELENNITRAYLSVLQAENNQQLLRDNISTLDETLRETEIIYENGFAEKLDVERLQLSLDNLNREMEKIVQFAELAKNLLKFQMNYPLEEDITLDDSFEQLYQQALAASVENGQPIEYENRPEYRMLSTAEALNKLNIERYQKGYLPSLRGFASYSVGVQRNNLFDSDENGWFPTSVLGLSASIPIFDGFDKRSKIQRAQISLDKLDVQRKQFEQVMNLEIQNARIALSNANASLQSTQRSLELAEKILNTSKIKFKEGVGSSLEVVQAEGELYTAQSNHTNAQYDLLVAVKDLEIAMGKK